MTTRHGLEPCQAVRIWARTIHSASGAACNKAVSRVAVCSSFRPFNVLRTSTTIAVIDDEYQYRLTGKEVPLKG